MVTQLKEKQYCPTAECTLGEAYAKFIVKGDPPEATPFQVWLLENPDSPLSLPGQIYLREHDYLHILLDLDMTAQSEAFVIGFTMGNDPSTTEDHVLIFKLAARLFYPKGYKFSAENLSIFDWGFRFGRLTHVKNLNKLDYSPYLSVTISTLRDKFGIDIDRIQKSANISHGFKDWSFV